MRISTSNSLLSLHSLGSGPSPPDATLLHCPLCQRRIGLWAFLPKPPAAEDEDDPMTGTSTDAAPSAKAKKAQPQRQLDVLREHRPYCPYVVRSTVLPSLPAPPQPSGPRRSESVSSLASVNGKTNANANANANAMEGWRAVMAVVSRYGTVQRQRLGLSRATSVRGDGSGAGTGSAGVDGTSGEGMDGEESSIEAMVAGVKSHGVSRLSLRS